MRYHYVPECPRCGSAKTGYYINLSGNFDYYKVVAQYMKKGEIVRIRYTTLASNLPELFCQDCNAEWYGEPEKKRYSLEELNDEYERRGITNESITENNYKISNAKIEFKKRKKQEKKEKRKRFIKKIIGFK